MRTFSFSRLMSAAMAGGCIATLAFPADLAVAQSTPPSEGGSYRLARLRVAAGTTEARAPETGVPRYRLQATAGQAEADPDMASAARYRLRGGFWAAEAAGELPSTIFADSFED